MATRSVAQIHPRDGLLTEEYNVFSILIRGSQADRLVPEGFPHPKRPALERDPARAIHLPDDLPGFIPDGRPLFRIGPGTGMVSARRRLHAQGFVRTLPIVEIAPAREDRLPIRQPRARILFQNLLLQRAMQVLIFVSGWQYPPSSRGK